MQLRGATPKGCRKIKINANMVSGECRDGAFGKVNRITEFAPRAFWKLCGSARLEIAVELLDGPLPAVALVHHQTLQEPEHGRYFTGGRHVFDHAGKGRDSIETCFLGQVSPYFTIRIHAGFQSAEQLED